MDELKPCPFCGEHLTKMSEAQGYFHSKKNCTLSDLHILADGYSEERWNTRSKEVADEVEATRADREAVTAFHTIMLKRIAAYKQLKTDLALCNSKRGFEAARARYRATCKAIMGSSGENNHG